MRRPERSSRRTLASLALALAVAAGSRPARAELFQIITYAFPSSTATTSLGAFAITDENHLLSAPVTAPVSSLLLGLARDPTTGYAYSVGFANRNAVLYRLDLDHLTATPIGPLPDTVRSLAFDSQGRLFGLVLCGNTYDNQLLQIDPSTAASTPLGGLDASRVLPCANAGFLLGGTIAIDPLDDAMYFAANDTNDNLFMDRIDPGLVPTLVYQSGASQLVPTLVPTAATVAGGKLWMALAATFLGPGEYYGAFDFTNLGAGPQGFSGAASRSLGQTNHSVVFGMVEASAACTPSATATCLDDRFLVQATYDATPANGSGPATVLLESGQSVKFSFFDPANVELIVKVLNACSPPFNHWWVAGGGLTNVGVQITVTDTRTGAVRTYTSTKGTLFQPFFDNAAFPCP